MSIRGAQNLRSENRWLADRDKDGWEGILCYNRTWGVTDLRKVYGDDTAWAWHSKSAFWLDGFPNRRDCLHA